jgi:2-oxo-4-hydroxy-4-carboxy-5-ureidoimidazoline decarboxylase
MDCNAVLRLAWRQPHKAAEPAMTRPIDKFNTAPRVEAVSVMELLVERSPWVAEIAVDARPFADHEELAAALVETMLSAGHARQVAMFNVHPELAGRVAAENSMTAASTSEQARLGLLSLSAHDAQRLQQLNALYRSRFGHPFIVALHRVNDLASLFAMFERRLAAAPIEEHATSLAEIASVIHSRAEQAFAKASILPPTTTDQE